MRGMGKKRAFWGLDKKKQALGSRLWASGFRLQLSALVVSGQWVGSVAVGLSRFIVQSCGGRRGRRRYFRALATDF
jgi:hypothetical protein